MLGLGMSLRDRIQQRLTDLGMSQREASLKAGLNSHFLKRIFDDLDKSIQVSSLESLAEALETSASWLLSGEGARQVDPELQEVIDLWDRRLDSEDKTAVRDFTEWRATKK